MRYLKGFLLVLIVAVAFSCKKSKGEDPEPEPTEAELRLEILTDGNGTWTPPASGAVMLGEGSSALDITELFEDFTITFSETGYTTTGTTPVWARSGTWEFVDDDGEVFRRNDGLEVTITEITEGSLKFTLEWDQTTYEEGRSKSLAGKHTFTLGK